MAYCHIRKKIGISAVPVMPYARPPRGGEIGRPHAEPRRSKEDS